MKVHRFVPLRVGLWCSSGYRRQFDEAAITAAAVVSSVMYLVLCTAHLSFCSTRIAPSSRVVAVSGHYGGDAVWSWRSGRYATSLPANIKFRTIAQSMVSSLCR